MNTLTKDEVSNMKLMMDVYIQSINEDLSNAEMDGETLMKVLTMTTNMTMLNAMCLAEMKEKLWPQIINKKLNNYKKNARRRIVNPRKKNY